MDVSRLRSLGACTEAVERVEKQPNLYSAWRAIRADWLLWFAAKSGMDRKIVVAAACDCAETVLHLVPSCEDRPRVAIQAARKWIDGKATLKGVTAADASADAAYAAYAAYAADAANAAAYASYAAYAASAASASYAAYAADAANAAAYASYAASAANAAAYASDAASAALLKLGVIVRKRITYQMIKEKWEQTYREGKR